jgi:APA family basic amino acid/polyamine antiporter
MNPDLTERQTLIRGLGLIAAISVIIGNVIGTGVFLKARVMTCNVGSPGWVIAAWIAAGLLSLAGALTYAELTSMRPMAGAQNVFLKETYGKVASFLFGWMQVFIARPGSQAAAGMAFAIGLNDFLGNKLAQSLGQLTFLRNPIEVSTISAKTLTDGGQIDRLLYSFELTTLSLVAVMVIVIFTTLNCASVMLMGRIATALTFVKLALILFVAIGAFVLVSGDFVHFSMANSGGTCEGVADAVNFGSPSYTFFAGFAAAMLGALWGYDGWDNLTFIAGEVKDPNRNIPLAIIGSTMLIIVLYVLAHVAYFYVLDPTTITSVSKNSSVAKVVVSMFFGGNLASIASGAAVAFFTVGLMLSSLGTLHTSLLSAGRVPYRMAREGMMFEVFGKVSVNHVPVPSILLAGGLSCILALIGSFDTLTDYVVFAMWIFYALITTSIFIYRRKFPNLARPYKAWGYPVVPIVFLCVAAWLLYRTVVDSPEKSVTGLVLIALGLPVYYFFTKRGIRMPDDDLQIDAER